MNAVATDTRTELLGLAQGFIQTRSYQGFSFQDLANAAGIKKGSLYYHFPSKEDLALEMLASLRRQFAERSQQVSNLPPVERLQLYLAVFANMLGAGQKMCPAGAFVAGWDDLSDTLKKAVVQTMYKQYDWVTKTIAEGQADGSIDDSRPANQQALWLIASIQGGLLIARTRGDVEIFNQCVQPTLNALISQET